MPRSNDPNTQSLRLIYSAAIVAHSRCARALTDATMRREIPSADLVEAEGQALLRMNEARENLHAALGAGGAAADRG